MGERKGTNKWIPPDFDPEKHGSLNKYHGSHPLGIQARKIHEGIVIVRFEMPWNAWCLNCNQHIGKGVRYNAEKKRAGKYFSTTIYEFKLKCHLCSGFMVIQTDPQNSDFKLISGVKKRTQEWDAEDAGVPELLDSKEKERMNSDPFYRLEKGTEAENKHKETKTSLEELVEQQFIRTTADGMLNRLARKRFRDEKHATLRASAESSAESNRLNVPFAVVSETEEDAMKASAVEFKRSSIKGRFQAKHSLQRANVKSRPMFGSSAAMEEKRKKKLDALQLVKRTGISPKDLKLISSQSKKLAPENAGIKMMQKDACQEEQKADSMSGSLGSIMTYVDGSGSD